MRFSPYKIQDNQIIKLDKQYEETQLDYLESISFGVSRSGDEFFIQH